MHVFLTGGSGQLGPAVISELITAGHRVTGLARSDAAAKHLDRLGAAVLRGSLDDLRVLAAGAEQADGVVHMAFGSVELHDPLGVIRRDMRAIRTLGEAVAGTDKPLVSTSGTFATAPGRISTEADPASPEAVAGLRSGSERVARELASQGVRSILVRLAPSVHGPGDRGLIPALVAIARRTGVSTYVGDGLNRWPAVHRLDSATLFRLALEKAPIGSVLHGVGETAVTLASIAHTIGEGLGVPIRSIDAAVAAEHFGSDLMAAVFSTDSPASSTYTRRLDGWSPRHPTLLQDLRGGVYF